MKITIEPVSDGYIFEMETGYEEDGVDKTVLEFNFDDENKDACMLAYKIWDLLGIHGSKHAAYRRYAGMAVQDDDELEKIRNAGVNLTWLWDNGYEVCKDV